MVASLRVSYQLICTSVREAVNIEVERRNLKNLHC
jgi:hypothetical protein